MRMAVALADRTAVLFLGIAAGAAIGYAFATGGEGMAPAPSAPVPAPAAPARDAPAIPVAANASQAEIAQADAGPFQPHLLKAVAAGDPVTVGVFGDSFGDGVWSALYRLLPAKERFRVLKYSRQSTGFTRYSSLNLEEHAGRQIDSDGPVDIAVISFGANDTQGVYAGGHAAALMSPEWQRIVGERVDSFVRLMRARGATVYWLGLPKMRAARFDADIAAMNDFYARRMAALRVPYVDIKPLTVDAAGDYAAYLPDPVTHEPRLMRANDGVHMSMNGYVVVTRGLAARIKAYVAAARTMAGGGVDPVQAAPPPVLLPAPAVAVVPPPPAPEPQRKAALPFRPEPTVRPKPKPAPEEAPKPKPRLDEAPKPKPQAEDAPKPKPKAEEASKPKPKAEDTAKPKVEPKASADAATPAKASATAKPAARADKEQAAPAKPVVVKPAAPTLRLTLQPPEPDTTPAEPRR